MLVYYAQLWTKSSAWTDQSSKQEKVTFVPVSKSSKDGTFVPGVNVLWNFRSHPSNNNI